MPKSRRVILDEETLRVAIAVLPYGRVGDQLWAVARCRSETALTVADVLEVLRLMDAALGQPRRIVDDEALLRAIDQYRIAVANLDYSARCVEVSVWDVLRDGAPIRAASARPPGPVQSTH